MNEKQRQKYIKYAMKKKAELELELDKWTRICRRLSDHKDFKPADIELIDTILEKVKDRGS